MSTVPARARSHKPLHLPGVENNPKPGLYKDLIDSARSRDAEYSKIWDLFAFQPAFTDSLSRFTQGVLRTPATISPAMRELIAAWTSFQNECRFCTHAHAAAAAELLGSEDLVRSVLKDLEASPLDERDKEMLRFVTKITRDLPAVTAKDVDRVRAAGWDDEAIYYAITTCALFNFYNRWITATGVAEMSEQAHRLQGQHLARHGYIREEGR
jgi:uncharacterized peroxidase-related enzyme